MRMFPLPPFLTLFLIAAGASASQVGQAFCGYCSAIPSPPQNDSGGDYTLSSSIDSVEEGEGHIDLAKPEDGCESTKECFAVAKVTISGENGTYPASAFFGSAGGTSSTAPPLGLLFGGQELSLSRQMVHL